MEDTGVNQLKKWIIRWDAGYGDCYETAMAPTEEEALTIAAEHWRQDAEDGADYSVLPWTKEAAEDFLE